MTFGEETIRVHQNHYQGKTKQMMIILGAGCSGIYSVLISVITIETIQYHGRGVLCCYYKGSVLVANTKAKKDSQEDISNIAVPKWKFFIMLHPLVVFLRL